MNICLAPGMRFLGTEPECNCLPKPRQSGKISARAALPNLDFRNTSMTMTVSPKRREPTGGRAVHIIAYFEEDVIAGRHLMGVQRFRRTSFENAEAESPTVERIVLVSLEEVVEKNYAKLRVPNVRVLALTNRRFKEPRNDGAVFAYLPPDIPPALLERMVDNALDHIQLVHTRREVNERLRGVTEGMRGLNQTGGEFSPK